MGKVITLDFADDAAATAFFDEAFQHPRKHYRVEPVDVETAKKWLADHSYRRNFGWTDADRTPFHLGELLHLDTLYYRNSCGYVNHEVDYGCDGPETPDSEQHEDDEKVWKCRSWSCPVAREAYLSDFKRLDQMLWQEYKQESRYLDDEDPCDEWMILTARPRHAYVGNVTVIGCGYNE